ncbi:NAD(P)-binding Rossmann-fold superfamily protein [Rhynchospora pubera]|uniref:NAD(P)-binding Rossmann-fold superfamily protein n=1 Tax=Rhynchospora pubera TaxID=906938 RepID=A0AAV8GHR1_9POAL|nr:NAD(P)-binding Rossmann-fold superfamily protein [Rhynchospora pubera]
MWPFNRKGPSGFSVFSTAEEVTQGIDDTGLTALVTGASSGIGAETSRVLALHGVHVVMGVRNLSAGERVKELIMKEAPNAKIDVLALDLSSLSSVRNFAYNFNALDLPLNILINNAGIAFIPFKLSEDGIELQFATNYLGHFLLTNLLLEKMKATSQENGVEGRIVIVSSDSYKMTYHRGIQFDKINNERRYNSILAYGQSKLANMLHCLELSQKLKDENVNITVNSLHPGAVVTSILRHHSFLDGLLGLVGKFVLKNVHQGAATTCYLALHPNLSGVTGKFFVDCNMTEVKSYGKDVNLAKLLWDFSCELIK